MFLLDGQGRKRSRKPTTQEEQESFVILSKLGKPLRPFVANIDITNTDYNDPLHYSTRTHPLRIWELLDDAQSWIAPTAHPVLGKVPGRVRLLHGSDPS